MAMRNRQQSEATIATAEALAAYVVEADRDGVRTEQEVCIINFLERAYVINEVQDTAEALTEQLRRLGDEGPNQPMMDRILEVSHVWAEFRHRRMTEGDQLLPMRNGHISVGEKMAA